MKIFLLCLILVINSLPNLVSSEETHPVKQNLSEAFNVGKMLSHDDRFTLFFKTREKAVLARGAEFNYITDYPQDLYILNNATGTTKPLITYDWFPEKVKELGSNYNLPVFPEDYAYYLLSDNETLVMISAVKSLNANFKFDIIEKKLELYPTTGKFDFIISSFAKNCGHFEFKDNYKCKVYKPLISSNLIN